MSNDPVRILIVDDSALYRLLLRDVLSSIPGCRVVGHAENGARALEQIEELEPDLVTLDVEMPALNGIDVLRALKDRSSGCQAVMVSRLTDTGAQATMDALVEGAFDFILKPSGPDHRANKEALARALAAKIEAFGQSRAARRSAPSPAEPDAPAPASSWSCAAVLIGASTGGPEALRAVLPQLPAEFPAPIIVVQHLPGRFTSSLAKRLDELCSLHVVEAEHGMRLQAGQVLVAPGGQQLRLVSNDSLPMIEVTDDPPEHGCRPSVDYALRSVSERLKGRALSVILTGMGRDGLEGSAALKRQGGRVLAQHADGCTVFGMPRAVIEAGVADRIAKLPHVAAVICDEVKRGR